MSEKDFEELQRLRAQSEHDRIELERLTKLINNLQQQLQMALNGNEQLKELLKDLQSKIDTLLTQTKKRNKREYGKKTEKHNPRPALGGLTSPPISKPSKACSTGIKHIIRNATHLTRTKLQHSVTPEKSICPECTVETVFVSNLITHQLEMGVPALKFLITAKKRAPASNAGGT